jgi:hypothetical protein
MKEFVQYIRSCKKWWLVPVVVALAVAAWIIGG